MLEQSHLHEFSGFTFLKDVQLSPNAVIARRDLEVTLAHSKDAFGNLLAHQTQQVGFVELKQDLTLGCITAKGPFVKTLHRPAFAPFDAVGGSDDPLQRNGLAKRRALEPAA